MNEHELRNALRGVMVASSPPPPMDTAAVVEAARRAHRRRRAVLAGTATALAVVVITVTAVVAPGWSALRGGQLEPAGPPVSETPRPTGTAEPFPTSGTLTETALPTGPDGKPQQDRTARAGPRHEQGARLLEALTAAMPAGYTVPPEQPPPDPGWAGPLQFHQAQGGDGGTGTEIWEYLAHTPVAKDGGVGLLFAQVHTPGHALPVELCAAAKTLWAGYGPDGPIDLGWQCQVVDVDSRQVGVISSHRGDMLRFDQWAVHRHPDGTVVFVAQAQELRGTGLPPLAGQPVTLEQLARLAIDPRFSLE